MRTTGARLAVKALVDEGVHYAFGIPGTHNLELYDAMADAPGLEPVLVTNEQSASFMADGLARTSGQVGVVNVVPGAGVSHSLSGVAEAFLDGVPMVVLACGIRTDTHHAYQLHAVDQLAMLAPVTKGAFHVERAADIYPMVRRAFQLARRGAPGPVAVEIPANLLMLAEEVEEVPFSAGPELPRSPDRELVERAARMLGEAAHPALYLGWGAAGAADLVVPLAEQLGAPVVTTFQGKGVFPEDHPLFLWNGFGAQAPRFVRRLMERCDCLLAIGCRFGELATGSYGITPPPRLLHVDIAPEVFNRNYPAMLAVEADARAFIVALVGLIRGARPWRELAAEIAAGERAVRERWHRDASAGRVTPVRLFESLQRHCAPDAVYATDSGNGTFLAIEMLRLRGGPGCFIAPVDYSCMGYAVPAAIGASLAHPGRDVVALPGDGAFLMTGLELLTASPNGASPLVCVLRDGKLSQIAQFQKVPYNRETCSTLPEFQVEGIASALRLPFFRIKRDHELDPVIRGALEITRSGRPVLIEVAIDVSVKTYFTRGVIRTNLRRLPRRDRLRMISRALLRRL
ncbi:MAG TPA: thiamine pyrophosphate-binding protein [Thermoanaerobaculales bacterium]|nr:thiamine pyrophosphate-binding protein [Thermoanaerobaculales bacterium]